MSAIVHQDPTEGMGTTNFATEILANYAVLDKDRQKQLIELVSRGPPVSDCAEQARSSATTLPFRTI